MTPSLGRFAGAARPVRTPRGSTAANATTGASLPAWAVWGRIRPPRRPRSPRPSSRGATRATAYSLDGQSFTDTGASFALAFGHWKGARVGIFSHGRRGHVDVDSVRYDYGAQPSVRNLSGACPRLYCVSLRAAARHHGS